MLTLNAYEEFRHWYKVLDEIDDVVKFLEEKVGVLVAEPEGCGLDGQQRKRYIEKPQPKRHTQHSVLYTYSMVSRISQLGPMATKHL